MTKKHQHGGDNLERQVMELYKEGWHQIGNIAGLAGTDTQTVRSILSRNKIILD